MELDSKKIRTEKIGQKYRALWKAFSADPKGWQKLQAAYTPDEMRQHEDRLANSSWDPNFLPGLVAQAQQRLDEKGHV